MVGMKYKKLSEQLQLDSKLTLEKATRKPRQTEKVKKHQPLANVDRLINVKEKDPKEKKRNHPRLKLQDP